MLGVSISPLHCKNDEFSELICENGIISAYTMKYFEASYRIAGSPPSHVGSILWMESPNAHKIPATHSAVHRP